MGRVLDLSIYSEETLDITTPKKNILHVKKPTEELAIKIIQYQSKAKELSEKQDASLEDAQDAVTFLRNLTVEILNYNTDGITVNEQYLKENNIFYALQMAILSTYTSWMSEVISDPNSKSPQSQVGKEEVIQK